MTDDVQTRLRAYARLLVRAGVNLTEGQELLVHAQHEHAPFVRAIAEEAYAAGARYVDVAYADRWVQRAFVDDGARRDARLDAAVDGARLERAIEVGAAIIGISADSGAEVLRGPRRRPARARPLPRLRPACGWTASWAASSRGRSSPTRPRAGRARRSASRTSTACGTPSRMPCGSTSPTPPRPGSSAWTSCRPARAS